LLNIKKRSRSKPGKYGERYPASNKWKLNAAQVWRGTSMFSTRECIIINILLHKAAKLTDILKPIKPIGV